MAVQFALKQPDGRGWTEGKTRISAIVRRGGFGPAPATSRQQNLRIREFRDLSHPPL